MVRWAQANALLPSMQFSIAPWTFDGECAQLCLKAIQWHHKYADLIVQLAKEATQTGWPIIRPMFWLAPNDKTTYTIGDQFVLGDKVVSQNESAFRSIHLLNFTCRLWLLSSNKDSSCATYTYHSLTSTGKKSQDRDQFSKEEIGIQLPRR